MHFGIKPIWVFEGKSPALKSAVLEDRIDSVAAASETSGDLVEVKKEIGQSIIISNDMNSDAK